jgi:hypothetical protein
MTKVAVNDRLLNNALRLSGQQTKESVTEEALRVFITLRQAAAREDSPGNAKKYSRAELRAMMENSVTKSLIGAVPYPDSDITPEEIRMERLRKYERPY